tara:strand:+ start:467 stop:2548 length:2082 start_codon:yes stop_codon:yes gene_type:complete
MSLIITSSQQDKYNGGQLGVERPYAYQNYLSNTMKIPPNSEVAVQSVKINRSENWVIDDDLVIGYLAYGPAYTAKDNILTKTNLQLVPILVDGGTYSNAGFGEEIKKALSVAYNSHPDAAKMITSVHTSGSKFAGYNLQADQLHSVKGGTELANATYKTLFYPRPILDSRNDRFNVALNPNDGSSTWQKLDGTSASDADLSDPTYITDAWDADTMTLWGTDGDGEGFVGGIFPQYPISHQKGNYEVSPPIGTVEWDFGLSRESCCGYKKPTVNVRKWETFNGVLSTLPPYMRDEDQTTDEYYKFMDYWVSVIYNPDGGADETGAFELQVGYYGFEQGAQGTTLGSPTNVNAPLGWRTADGNILAYWNESAIKSTLDVGGGAIAYDWGVNADNISAIKITVDNEQVYVEAYDVINGWRDLIGNALTSYVYPSITTNKWSLYPKLFVQNKDVAGNSATINNFYGRDMSDTQAWDVGGTGWTAANQWFGNSQYYKNLTKSKVSGGWGGEWAEDMDRRPSQDPDYTYVSSTVNINDLLTYNPLFVLNRTPDIIPKQLIEPEPQYLRKLLGMDPDYLDAANATSTDATKGQFIWTSVSTPQLDEIGGKTLFVSCPDLTHQSYNFGKGTISKILYQIPQFSNTGDWAGSLYFEANYPTYIKLGNKETLELNKLNINIVDRDEKPALDLEGNTTVVLHIR